MRWRRAPSRLLLVVAGAIAMVCAAPAVAVAAPAAGSGSVATLNGRSFDLSRGWGDAQACVVFSRTVVKCYESTAQADAALGYKPAADPLVNGRRAAAPACSSGWLCLYENTNGGGRRLQFRDEYWNYLSAYSFDRQTSSWRNAQGGGDNGHLSLYNSSSVYLCGAGSYASSMGVYDNQAYAVWG